MIKDVIQIQNMQKIISQIPELTSFLARIPKSQQPQAIKHLIRLGLQTTRSSCCKENRSTDSNILRKQIDSIKDSIEELNHMVRRQCHHYCHTCDQNQRPEKVYPTYTRKEDGPNSTQNVFGHSKGKEDRPNSGKIAGIPTQKPVRDSSQAVLGQLTQNIGGTVNPFSKNKSILQMRNLDDSGSRDAMTFPTSTLLEPRSRIKRKSQEYKKYIYQQQINQEQLGKIKEERGQSLDRIRRDRTVSDYNKATSKIKPLLDKDRIRYTQRQCDYEYKQGFNKYEYSDENQMEESSMHEEQAASDRPRFAEENTYNQHFQSSFKASQPVSSSQKSHKNKTSSKKDFQRSKKEVSSKLEASVGEEVRQELHSSQGGSKKYQQEKSSGSRHKYQQEKSSGNNEQDSQEEEDDDVVSNSSSFSQFSINGSRRKDVGKISRRSQNDD